MWTSAFYCWLGMKAADQAAPSADRLPRLDRITAAAAIFLASSLPSIAKTPGATHCYNDICHRVLTLAETEAHIGRAELILASHYGAPGRDPSNPRLETSSGEIFKPDRDDNVASPIFPDGTRLLLWNPANGHAASVRVNNAGPYARGRMIDTSEHVARKLGFHHQGIARIYTVVIAAPSQNEASYQRGRVYPRVAGYLGRFEHLKLAMLADNTGLFAVMRPAHQDDRLASLAIKQPQPTAAGTKPAGNQVAHLVLASRTVATPKPFATTTERAARPAPRAAAALVRPSGSARQAVVPLAIPRPEPKSSTTRCVFDHGPACS